METATITPDIRHLIETTFEEQRTHAPHLAQSKSRDRRKKLDRLQAYLRDPRHIEALNKAMHKDLGKPETEVIASETGIIHAHIKHVKRHLRDWMSDKRVSTPWSMVGTRSWIRYEPKGVCLILSPWNYPLNLALVPLVYALAAGNAVILTPSEISRHT